MTKQNNCIDNTKERILAEAEKLFAEKGYNGVSVREITQAAGCNLAAVNYHFGNKKKLYFDVFRYLIVPRISEVRSQFEQTLAHQEMIDFESVIRAFTTAFMKTHMEIDGQGGHHSLIHREFHNPTGAIEIIIREAISPFFHVLIDKIKTFLPEEISETKIKLNVFSILALSLYFSHARLPVSIITGKEYDDAFVKQLVDHTVSFAMYGLNGNKEEAF